MNLSTANTIAGGIIFGIVIFVVAMIILAVGVLLYKKEKINSDKGVKRASVVTGTLGLVICVISGAIMIFTGNTGNVGTVFATMRSSEQAIYNDKFYVKTDFLYNGGKGKYRTEKAESVLSGAGDLYTLKGYSSYDVLVEINSNITGSIFVEEADKPSFEKYYKNYESNYNVGALFDTHDNKMTSIEKEADASFYSKLVNLDSYKETSKDNVPYAEDITSTKCCIFWATSKDNLVTSQITIFPKDKQGKFIRYYDQKYYQLDESLTAELEKYFK